MYLSTDMWYKKVQVILGLIKRENLIVVTVAKRSASESRKMGQFTILLYPASSFNGSQYIARDAVRPEVIIFSMERGTLPNGFNCPGMWIPASCKLQ